MSKKNSLHSDILQYIQNMTSYTMYNCITCNFFHHKIMPFI